MDHQVGDGSINLLLRGLNAGAWKDLDDPIQGNNKAWDQDFVAEAEKAVGAGVMVTDFILRSAESVHLAHPLQQRHGVAVYGALWLHLISRRAGLIPHSPEEGLERGVGRDIMKGGLRVQVGRADGGFGEGIQTRWGKGAVFLSGLRYML